MGYDIEYNANASIGSGPDNVVGDDNNYSTTTGAACKAARCIVSEFKDIDGEPMGNRGWSILARGQDTPQNRQLLEHYTRQALQWLIDNKEIRDVEITVGDPLNLSGLAMQVRFYDVRAGDTASLGFVAPWGRM